MLKKSIIGKTTSGLENIEVLTSYSDITFSQIDGAVGNLNISNSSRWSKYSHMMVLIGLTEAVI